MNLINTIINWLKAKRLENDKEFTRGYEFTKTRLPRWDQDEVDAQFCQAYSQIFVNDYWQGVRKALCEYHREQLKNEK
jgi:hypothetical protein